MATGSRTRQERAEATRRAILDGAATAFDAAGFGSTSLTDIAQHAGVTKGAMYFHFQSKEALARELVAEQFELLPGGAESELRALQRAIDLTHRMAHGLRSSARLRAGIRLVIERGSFSTPDPSPYNQWIDSVRAMLANAQGAGDLKSEVDVGDLSTYIVGAFTGVQITSQVRTAREDLHERVADLWTWLLPGVVPARRLARFAPAGSEELWAALEDGAATG
ncbi:ScbR family autoregulator-binding transcription factor [Streptomyces prasinopilosus]|uniref:Transcriptional regulator, TetR family n=1 Tax=Streptomyces prasinopilosus TaxID=67344 RepID=A0A1G6LBF8_9ACTN|nr:ScbR family autoregulator-binding transcription factor [Streptomyces prasinopilosus]SDC40367.1 transcriptional regulator, TetR family [Streptomyces prasinopilosus]